MKDLQYVTLEEVLEEVDSLKPNSFTRQEKVWWLSTFDGRIFTEILATHQDAPEGFQPYDPDRGSQMLLVPQPYGRELYMAYLENTMDHFNGDTARFNNSLDRLASLYNSFFRWYHSQHQPLGGKRKYW